MAPRNDLETLQALSEYQVINPAVARVATAAMLRHLLYLSKENVGFSFFDVLVDPGVKELMVQAMKEQPGSAEDRPLAHPKIHPPMAATISIADLFT